MSSLFSAAGRHLDSSIHNEISVEKNSLGLWNLSFTGFSLDTDTSQGYFSQVPFAFLKSKQAQVLFHLNPSLWINISPFESLLYNLCICFPKSLTEACTLQKVFRNTFKHLLWHVHLKIPTPWIGKSWPGIQAANYFGVNLLKGLCNYPSC